LHFLLATALTLTDPAPAPPDVYSGRDNQLRVAIPRLEEQIDVDGVLEEPAWSRAARLTGFSQYAPVDGRPAENSTEVLVWYSPTAIHFGIRAQAPRESVRATLANRDKIDSDDSILLFLSPFNDGRQALVFGVNPLGVQSDGALVEGSPKAAQAFGTLNAEREATDLSPDFVFDSKGRLTDGGYEIEVRIPFKSLRYPSAAQQDWGLNVVRRIQSTGHEDSWAPARRSASSFLAQSGVLQGLTDLRRGLVLDLNPVVTAKADGAPSSSGWKYDAGAPEVGGNVRWGVTTNLTLNGTVNPDFSQVESDAEQFTFDPRSALFFPEKRPFFLDGIEQFATPNQLIYTRRVVSPLGAAKLTGKTGGTTLAALTAVDDASTSANGRDHPLFGILRLQRDVGGRSKAAFVYTDRTEDGGYNRVAALDTRLAFGGIYSLQLQGALSGTKHQGDATTAPLWEGIFDRNGRRFGLRYRLTGIDEDFRAESGFIARSGVARAVLDHRVSFFGAKGSLVESFSSDVVLDGTWPYARFVHSGAIQDRKLHFNNSAKLRGGWEAGASILIETFGYDEKLYAGYAIERPVPGGVEIVPFTGTPRIPNLDYVLTLNTPQFQTFSGTFFYLWGHDENFFEWATSDIQYLNVTADWRPTDKLRLSASYQLQQFDRRTDGSTVGIRRNPRLKVEYQLTRAVFFRLVGDYDAERQDDLRDDSRTGLPLLIRDPATGAYARARGFERNHFRVDALFAYQPNPGTVVFAGYGSTLTEPEALHFGRLRRANDGLFVKISYLFRL
jgi:Domain of unknown function (DUF5916)